MRGKKPTATVLKLLRGNPGGRPLNQNEPRPVRGCSKPAFIRGAASKIWDRYYPEMNRLGILTLLDTESFSAFCIQAAKLETNPEQMTASDFNILRMLSQDLGMTPTSRPRLKVPMAEDSPRAEDFFAVPKVPASNG